MNSPTQDEEYTRELEKIIIFLCDVYAKGQDSLTCQTTDGGTVDGKWADIYMSFPTIQGTANRIYVGKIGNLRTWRLNREAPKISFQELYERLKVSRRVGAFDGAKRLTSQIEGSKSDE